jgi:hypothetical protein
VEETKEKEVIKGDSEDYQRKKRRKKELKK